MHQVVTAQLAAKRAGTQSTKTRAEVSRWRRQAVEAEGHRPRPRRLVPLADLARRWRGPRPEAPSLRPEDPQEDEAPRAGARPCRTAPPTTRSSSSTTGTSTPRRPRTPVAALVGARCRGSGARRARARGHRPPGTSFRNLPEVHVISRRRAQHLRRAGERLRRLHQARRCRPRVPAATATEDAK